MFSVRPIACMSFPLSDSYHRLIKEAYQAHGLARTLKKKRPQDRGAAPLVCDFLPLLAGESPHAVTKVARFKKAVDACKA